MWLALLVLIICTLLLYAKYTGWLEILYATFARDMRALKRFTGLNYVLWKLEMMQMTVPKKFVELTRKHPKKVAFYFEDDVWTFSQVDEYSNRIANYFKQEGFTKGDTVALYLESRPEYVCIWLGLSKIGVVTALINTNLVNDPLIHSIKVANSKAIIFGSQYVKAVEAVQKDLSSLKLYQYYESTDERKPLLTGCKDLRDDLEYASTASVSDINSAKPKDKLIYIYTSGTTGLPKAAVITHFRFIVFSVSLTMMAAFNKDDIVYDPLPLYHSAGGMLGVGQCLINGLTVVIRKKFSASNFWKDCIRHRCTIAQYIGETCRYVLSATANKEDHKGHSVRLMVGNGMRPQIWEKFVATFQIPEIYEFYGATEGNSNLINLNSKPGAVGFVPRYCRFLYPVALVKCDLKTGEPIRGEDGFCIPCKPHEAGVFLGKISPKKTFFEFVGYADEKATKKKIEQNVFRKGDFYFNSGDILEYDEYGYYYFRDRTGDTFRWKGENVSTSEVEAVISNIAELKDAIVFGIEVPHNEGRAGMVAIVDTDNSLDINALAKGLKENLPTYAVPIFVRIMQSVPMTGTYKLKKKELQDEGYDLAKVTDKLFFYNSKEGNYVPFTQELYDDLQNGKLRL